MSTQATQRREHAFEEFAEAVQDELGERIHEIILYGSTARGEATEQSDVDVLVVFNNNERPKKLYELAFDIGLEYGVVITPHVQTKDHFVPTGRTKVLSIDPIMPVFTQRRVFCTREESNQERMREL